MGETPDGALASLGKTGASEAFPQAGPEPALGAPHFLAVLDVTKGQRKAGSPVTLPPGSCEASEVRGKPFHGPAAPGQERPGDGSGQGWVVTAAARVTAMPPHPGEAPPSCLRSPHE